MDRQDRLLTARATEKVDEIIGFYVHAGIYVIVCASLFMLNALVDEVLWAHWPAIGWGIGVVVHAAFVFGRSPASLAHWRQRKIDAVRAQMAAQG